MNADLCSLDLDHANVGIYAVNTSTGKVVAEKNSRLSMMPSSCIKIVTTAAALNILGANTRFETYLQYDGVIGADKVLRGNLYIHGGGDPCLGSGRCAGSLPWKEQIEAWVKAIQALGIQKIEGKVLADASKWEKALAVPSWSWEDLGNYYGAGACALSFHENSYALFFKPAAKVGEAAHLIRTEPPMAQLAFQNEVKTGAEGSGDCACIYGSEFSPTQFIRGTIPAAVDEFAIKGAIPDPASYCANLLAEQLKAHGVAICQKEVHTTSKRVIFHTTRSPTVGEIVYWTNQKSINLYAEHLLKKMGEMVYNEGSTAAGIKAVTEFWRSQKIDLNGFYMVDGSGLSRKNMITANQLVEILVKMKSSQDFPLFYASLPLLEGTIRAKTGSMSLAKGYVGYTEDDKAFAIIVNQCADRKLMNQKMNAFITQLSTDIKSDT